MNAYRDSIQLIKCSLKEIPEIKNHTIILLCGNSALWNLGKSEILLDLGQQFSRFIAQNMPYRTKAVRIHVACRGERVTRDKIQDRKLFYPKNRKRPPTAWLYRNTCYHTIRHDEYDERYFVDNYIANYIVDN